MIDKELARNLRAVAHAIAQQDLEGLIVPASTVDDLHRIARGEMSVAEAIARVYRGLGRDPPPLERRTLQNRSEIC